MAKKLIGSTLLSEGVFDSQFSHLTFQLFYCLRDRTESPSRVGSVPGGLAVIARLSVCRLVHGKAKAGPKF